MKNATEDFTNEKLARNFRMMLADAEALIKATASQGDEKLEALRAKAEVSLNQVKQYMGHAQSGTSTHVRAAASATDSYVHDNPWKALGLAAGAGLIFGMFSRRS